MNFTFSLFKLLIIECTKKYDNKYKLKSLFMMIDLFKEVHKYLGLYKLTYEFFVSRSSLINNLLSNFFDVEILNF